MKKILSMLLTVVLLLSMNIGVFAAELVSYELGASVSNGIVSGKQGEIKSFTIHLYENGNLKEDTGITIPTSYILDETGLHATSTTATCTFLAGNSNAKDLNAQVEIKSNAKASYTPYSIRLSYVISNADSGLKDNEGDYLRVIVNANDTTEPIVTATPDRAANENGWYNGNVTVSFSAIDPESTIISVDGPKTVSSEGMDQVVLGSATNSAGLTGTGSITISIDKTAPTISGSVDRAANADGWYNNDVTVSFIATDALSGIGSFTSPVTLRGDCENQSVTGTGTDKAGNGGSTTVTGINIDKTKPTITASTDGVANSNGWYNKDVIVTFDAKDTLSGVKTVTNPVTIDEGKNQSVIGTATDKADNSESITVSGINIDKTAPVINAQADGQIFLLNSVIEPVWSVEDALSGIDETKTGITGFNTSSEGTRSYTITVMDKAGNTTVKTVSYTVWGCSGFLAPLKDAGTYKAGSTIPVKLVLTTKDEQGNTLTVADKDIIFEWKYEGSSLSNAINPEILSTVVGTTGQMFRYDATAGQYIYNYKTLKTDAGKAIKITAKFNGIVLDETIVNLK